MRCQQSCSHKPTHSLLGTPSEWKIFLWQSTKSKQSLISTQPQGHSLSAALSLELQKAFKERDSTEDRLFLYFLYMYLFVGLNNLRLMEMNFDWCLASYSRTSKAVLLVDSVTSLPPHCKPLLTIEYAVQIEVCKHED